MTADRCKHELLIAECGLCKPRMRGAGYTATQWQAMSDAAAGWMEHDAESWFPAGYSGWCKGCGERIAEGEMIRYAPEEGGFICAECGLAA